MASIWFRFGKWKFKTLINHLQICDKYDYDLVLIFMITWKIEIMPTIGTLSKNLMIALILLIILRWAWERPQDKGEERRAK
jgi:hypothetical protein